MACEPLKGVQAHDSIEPLVPVTILSVAPTPLLHGGLGIVRSLGRLGIPVHWIHSDLGAPPASSRMIKKRFVWEGSLAGSEAAKHLTEIGQEIGSGSILIPTDDAGSVLVNTHADDLKGTFRFPAQPAGLSRDLASKKSTYYLAKERGVPVPTTLFLADREDVEGFIAEVGLPLVLKIVDADALQRVDLPSVTIIHTELELFELYDGMGAEERASLMLQEYIPGGPESVWMFNGYFDCRSDCLFGATGKKVRQYPPYTGATTLGVCLGNSIVNGITRDFMSAIGYQGILDIGYRYDSRDQRYKLLDVNPRVGATFRLFVGESGMDVARALYLDLMGQPVPAAEVPDGRRWVVESLDLYSSWQYFRHGRLGFMEWIRSFQGVKEGAWAAGDDVRPLVKMIMHVLQQAGKRVVHSFRRP